MWTYQSLIFKKSLQSPFIYLAFILPVLFTLGLGWMIPLAIVFSFTLMLGLIIIGLLVFGGGLLEIRKTTFIKSLSVTKLSKTNLFLTHFNLSLFYSLILFIFLISLTILLELLFNFYAEDFSKWADVFIVYWINISIESFSDIYLLTFIYSFVLALCLSFGLGFLISSIIKSSINLYLFTFTYLLIFIFLCWIIIPAFLGYIETREMPVYSLVTSIRYFIPHYWVTSLMSNSLAPNLNLSEGIYNSIEVFKPELIDQYGEEAIRNALDNFEEFLFSLSNPNDWNWEALRNDLDYLYDWYSSGNWILYEDSLEAILKAYQNGDYSSPGGSILLVNDLIYFFQTAIDYINQYIVGFESNFFNNEKLLLVLQAFPTLTESLFIPLFEALFSEASEDILTFLLRQEELWDWNDLYSMCLSFLPLIMSIILIWSGIGLFEWSIR